MPVIYPYKSTFTRGEITPLLHGRADLEYYQHGLAFCKNWTPLRFGGITKRPGSYFVNGAKNNDKSARLIPFIFSTEQAYQLEFGENYFRVYAEQQPVLSGMMHVEVATPYDEDDLIDLRYVQSGDVLYIVHPNYAPRQVSRLSHTSWAIDLVTFLDGPYLDVNPVAALTVTRSGAGPTSYTLTWSADDGINDGAGFTADDVGRQIRILHPPETEWAIWVITAVTNPTTITATLEQGTSNTTATPDWRLSAWGAYEGWPSRISFYQQRLFYARTLRQPETLWGSRPYFFTDFRPGANDDDGVTFSITGEQVSEINWIKEGAVLAIGTVASTRALGPGETGVLTPSSWSLTPEVDFRTTATPPIRVGGLVLFAGAFGRSFRELIFEQSRQGFVAPDIALLSEHLLADGILEIAYVQEPLGLIYLLMQTGELVSITYDREQGVTGFAPVKLAGDPVVESISAIPGTFSDELWMVCVREIDGGTVRYIEVLQEPFLHKNAAEDAWFLDCASFYVGVAASVFSGMDYLEGETVGIWSEGAYLGTVEIVGGEFTLPDERESTNLIVGLEYEALAITLPFHGDVTGEGDVAHDPMLVNQGMVDVYRTIGLEVGTNEKMYPVEGRDPEDGMDTGPSLRTGVQPLDLGDNWANGGQVVLRSTIPAPALVRSLKVGLDV